MEPSPEDLYEDMFSFLNFMDEPGEVADSEMKAFVKAQIIPLMRVLISNLTLNRKSKDILKIYLLINTFLKREEILKHLPKKFLKQYFDSYLERIKLFREDKTNSSYQRDVLELQTAMNTEQFSKIIKSKNTIEFKNLVDEYLKKSEIESILNVLQKIIHEKDMPLYFFIKLIYLFKELHKKYNTKEFKQKIQLIKANYFDVLNILSSIFKNHQKGKDEKFVYDIAKILIPKVYEEKTNDFSFSDTTSQIQEPKSYNLVINFLKFIQNADKKNEGFTYSKDFVKELVGTLEEVIIETPIKKVQTAYDSALKYFKIEKEIDIIKINKFINTKNYNALEEYYLKEHIEKGTAKLFQDYIFKNITEYYYSSDLEKRLLFILIKVYIDNYPEKTHEELREIIAPYIKETDYKNIAKYVSKIYPQYSLFYYPIYEDYIKPFLIGKAKINNAKVIINYLASALNAKNSGFTNFDDKIIGKAISYVKPFIGKSSISKKMKEAYLSVVIAFDEDLTHTKLF